mmetsp:Transcript_28198/g.40863  ORF Transcript_28198/g.40863 Transcript_28198/m.40863 type:complete len:563 (+) Transcript_28198:81-1769(+)
MFMLVFPCWIIVQSLIPQWSTVFDFHHSSSTLQRRPFCNPCASKTTSSSSLFSSAASPSSPTPPSAETTNNALLSTPDPAFEEALPPSASCPFSGISGGPNSFYKQVWQQLQTPRIFSYLHKGQPVAEITGGTNVKSIFNDNYTKLQANGMAGVSQIVCGKNTFRTAQTKAEHKALKQLVSAPLTQSAVAKAIPIIQQLAEQVIKNLLNRDVQMADVAEHYILDITWRQLMGLELTTPEQIEKFHEQSHIYLKGMYSRPGSPELEACLKAREYLMQAMQEKIDALVKGGQSDGSAIGGLLYATLETDSGEARRLSHVQIKENMLVVMVAGTETSSSMLACAVLLMGLHPCIYKELQLEQDALVGRFGTTVLTQAQLEAKNCPLLDSMLHEVLRLCPVNFLSRSIALETLTVDGFQIPKGWAVSFNIGLTHEQDKTCESFDNSNSNKNSNMMGHMDLLEGFHPDRWQDAAARPTTDFMPFGVGPRRCSGNLLAMAELKTFMALFARTVDFDLAQLKAIKTTHPNDSPEEHKRRYLDEIVQWQPLSAVSIPLDGIPIVTRPRQR